MRYNHYYEVWRHSSEFYFYDKHGKHITYRKFLSNGADDVDYTSIDSNYEEVLIEKFAKMKDAKKLLASLKDKSKNERYVHYREFHFMKKIELA